MSVQLGGMALRDGVLLQSERFWAAATRTADGVKVTPGAKRSAPGRDVMQRMPVVRGIVRLGESLAMLPAVRRGTGSAVLPQEDPRLLGATVASALATLAVRGAGKRHPLLAELAAAGISLAPVLLALRDSRLARYHGAEHKSVAAYERGVAPAEAHREHERCGSNLLVPMVLTNVVSGMLLRAAGKEHKPLATFVAGLVSIGTAMELFSWMARHQDHPLARTLRLPGIELQRLFTTSEPSGEQLDVAHEALQELLRLEGAAPA